MLYSKTDVAGYSKFLVRLAWAVEIIAVLIGLTISLVVAISAFNSFSSEGDGGLLEGLPAILVAGLPFVLIAVVELCKIPLTFTFMNVKHPIWRGCFLLFVVFLCMITFETMLNGFERNFSNLNRSIDERKNSIESVESEIALLEMRRSNVVKFTEDDLVAEVEGNRDVIQAEYTQNAMRIDQRAQNTLAGIDYSFKDELDAEIAALMVTRDEYYTNWAAETAAVEERFSVMLLGNISGSTEERERLLAELNVLKAEFDQAMAKATFLTRATVETKYRKLIASKEEQVATITTGYLGGDAIEKQSTMEGQLRQQLAFVNNKYQGRVDDVTARIESLKAEIVSRTENNAALEQSALTKAANDKRYFARVRNERAAEVAKYEESKLEELAVITEKSFGIDEQIFVLRNKQRELQSEINHLINQNQVYRMAMYAYGTDSPTDVDRKMVGVVGLLWFGSLSLIASVCGVMLALAGFYLRRCLENVHVQEQKEAEEALKAEEVAKREAEEVVQTEPKNVGPKRPDAKEDDLDFTDTGVYTGSFA